MLRFRTRRSGRPTLDTSHRGKAYGCLWPLRQSVSALTTTLSKINRREVSSLPHTYFKFVLSVSKCGRLSENPEVIAVWPTSSVYGIFWSSTLHKVSKLPDIMNNPLKCLRYTRASDRNAAKCRGLNTP